MFKAPDYCCVGRAAPVNFNWFKRKRIVHGHHKPNIQGHSADKCVAIQTENMSRWCDINNDCIIQNVLVCLALRIYG